MMARIHGETTTVNGKTTCSKEYSTYRGMKQRCSNSNNQRYSSYGGRGIKVCDRWLNSFDNFLSDMGRAPSSEYSIERIDNDGNYEPNNCVWALSTTQARNTRGTKLNASLVKYIREQKQAGAKYSDLAKEIGVHRTTVSLVAKYKTWKDVK